MFFAGHIKEENVTSIKKKKIKIKIKTDISTAVSETRTQLANEIFQLI